MSIPLSSIISGQISNKRLDTKFLFYINSVNRSDYLLSWKVSTDKAFGSTSATFTLNNTGGIFGEGGDYRLYVGDIVELIEMFDGDSTVFRRFYGIIDQRAIDKSSNSRTITLTCLDYISVLQKNDIDLDVEGTKVQVTEETLIPQYLAAPNNNLAQVFNFANNAIAQDPPPLIMIRPKSGTTLVGETPQFDGFDIKYEVGQVVLGTPLNALDNYDLVATSYFHYTKGIYVEDVLEAILTQEDGYNGYLFGESSAQAVIDNHLTTAFQTVRGSIVDTLVPNTTESTIAIKTKLTSAITAGATSISVVSTEGLPSSGSGSISGDSFTWSGKTSTTLTGIPSSGDNSLNAHSLDNYVKYETTYPAGQVWYFYYSNIQSDLDASGSSYSGLPSGVTISYTDKRIGRIILSSAISTSTVLTHTGNYTFKTLQATGVELNRIKFNSREVESRFDAINKLRNYLNPNYIIRTEGDNKIWSSYLYQKTTADYTLNLVEQLNFMEDEDLYTRVKFFGKNINPNNILFNNGVQFVSSGQDYKSTATQDELQYEKESDDGNFWVYKTTITDAGKIDTSVIKPTIYINNVPVNDHPQIISAMPVTISARQRTETTVTQKRSGTPTAETRQYFFYTIKFAHTGIDPTQSIYLYGEFGNLLYTIAPGQSGMDYSAGAYVVPGTDQNSTIEGISTASYTVFYSTGNISIDVDTVRFSVSKTIVPSTTLAKVTATYQYWTALTPFSDVGAVIDGRFDTQVQTQFYAEPPTGLAYAILDLGQVYTIQALDILAGFFKPDDYRKFNVNFKISLQYSLDNISYYYISPETRNVQFQGGSSKKFEEKELTTDFRARYLRVDIEDITKIEYQTNTTSSSTNRVGVWVIAFSEISAYSDIILKSECKLIPTTYLSDDVTVESLASSGLYPTVINVESTQGFDNLESGGTATAYIGTDAFTYTGITDTSFLGVLGLSENHSTGDRVSQTLEDDNSVYDFDGLLPKLGDRLYKKINVNNDVLYTQTQLDALSKAYLIEFYKNHTKIKTSIKYAPYLKVGDTVYVVDTYNNISTNYFVESISDTSGSYELVLARYPA